MSRYGKNDRPSKWQGFAGSGDGAKTTSLKRVVRLSSLNALGAVAPATVWWFDDDHRWLSLIFVAGAVMQIANAAYASGRLKERALHQIVYPDADLGERFEVKSPT